MCKSASVEIGLEDGDAFGVDVVGSDAPDGVWLLGCHAVGELYAFASWSGAHVQHEGAWRDIHNMSRDAGCDLLYVVVTCLMPSSRSERNRSIRPVDIVHVSELVVGRARERSSLWCRDRHKIGGRDARLDDVDAFGQGSGDLTKKCLLFGRIGEESGDV